MAKKQLLLKKVSTFFNKTSRRANAYASGASQKKVKNNKVAPAPREKKKESLSEYDKRRDHESAKDPKGKDGWRAKEHRMIKSTC